MGTRWFLGVKDQEGEMKVAQYNEFDGYPSGQGVEVLEFIKNKNNREKLLLKLTQIVFLKYNTLEELMNKAEADPLWFTRYVDRTLGSTLLDNLIETDEVVELQNNSDFINNKVFCEWSYIIDYQRNILDINQGKMTYSLDNLPTKDQFILELDNLEE